MKKILSCFALAASLSAQSTPPCNDLSVVDRAVDAAVTRLRPVLGFACLTTAACGGRGRLVSSNGLALRVQ